MSEPDFVKCVCPHCDGPLEFPAAAAGATVDCPHCGQPVVLTIAAPPRRFRPVWALLIAAATVAAIALAVVFHSKSETAAVPPNAPPPSHPTNAVTSALQPEAPTPSPDDTVTNDFAVSPGKMASAPGSSLVYVTGRIHNLSERQRYGVKITFDLLDVQTNTVGKASDYRSVLDPQAEWHFKAMVIAGKAASARLASISEK